MAILSVDNNNYNTFFGPLRAVVNSMPIHVNLNATSACDMRIHAGEQTPKKPQIGTIYK